jgi:hypothetical protein
MSKIKRRIHKLVSTTFMATIMAIVQKYGANSDVHYL